MPEQIQQPRYSRMFSTSTDNTISLFNGQEQLFEESFQMDPAFAYNEHQHKESDNFFYHGSDQDVSKNLQFNGFNPDMVEMDHSQQLFMSEREEDSQELHSLFGSSNAPATTSNQIVAEEQLAQAHQQSDEENNAQEAADNNVYIGERENCEEDDNQHDIALDRTVGEASDICGAELADGSFCASDFGDMSMSYIPAEEEQKASKVQQAKKPSSGIAARLRR